jgi:phosphatidylglycerophosphatase A
VLATLCSFLGRLIATGLFSGYAPIAPGTAGSLVGLLLYLILGFEEPAVILPCIIIMVPLGAYLSARTALSEGTRMTFIAARRKSEVHGTVETPPDPSVVVIDEIVGMWIALALLPKSMPILVIAFIMFRVLDVVKPFPVRNLERLPHGWGIMLDDVAAGIYTNVICRIVLIWT